MTLTPKQEFVIGHAALSFQSKQIASMMGRSIKTVEKIILSAKKRLVILNTGSYTGILTLAAYSEQLIKYDVKSDSWSYTGAAWSNLK